MIARRFRLLLAAVLLAGAVAGARADDAPAQSAPEKAEEASMQGYGLANPACQEWSDGCFVCARDSAGVGHCSTAGVACQAQAVVCRRTGAAP